MCELGNVEISEVRIYSYVVTLSVYYARRGECAATCNAEDDLWTRLEILLDVLVFVFLVQTCQCCMTKQDECRGPVMLHLLSCCDELKKLFCVYSYL